MSRITKLVLVGLFVVNAVGVVSAYAAAPYFGKSVVDVLEDLREQGLQIAYSTRLVPNELVVRVEPRSTSPMNAVAEILADHGLTIVADDDLYLVVLMAKEAAVGGAIAAAGPTEPRLENITVLASRYEVKGNAATRAKVMSQDDVRVIPDLGDDPIRIVQTLPGTAASGASAETHFRGGNVNEVGIILNGMELFDPFHVRDFQNIFSTIDSNAISDVEVFTGGYPTQYGDHLSGIVLLESFQPEQPRKSQIGISVYNTSLLHAAESERAHWLFSARRGNLDLVINDKLGKPSYYDLFSQVRFDLSARSSVSVNAIYAEDSVAVILESEPLELEFANSSTRNFQVWLQLKTNWSEQLSSQTTVSRTDYSNRRIASINDEEKLVASVNDSRRISETGIRQDWSYNWSPQHYLQWGFSGTSSQANFDYSGSAEYFGLPALFENQVSSVARVVNADPGGGRYGLYVSDRWHLSDTTTLESGLRWDDQTYTALPSDSQISPRLAILKHLNDAMDLRLSWGRYHQSQAIQDLQVEDDVTNYWPAQRADHFIASLNYRINDNYELRIEAYRKDIRGLQPRFENLFDPLALIPEFSPDRVQLDASRATSSGLELSLNGAHHDFSWWAAYTLSKANDRIDGRDHPRSWDQRHAFQGGLTWSNEKWDVSVVANWRSGWPTTGLTLLETIDPVTDESSYVAVPESRNTRSLNSFASMGFRAERKFDLQSGRLSAFVELSNLTNRRNVCCIDYDVGEEADGSLSLESSPDYWLPFLPAVGILWEF